MKRLLVIAAALAALALPAPALAEGCPGEDDNVTSATIAQAELAMACLVNQFRQANGLPALVLHSQLATAARAHSQDMDARNYFDHVSPSPSSTDFQQRAIAAGYSANAGVGENIASAVPSATPDSLMSQFIRSAVHTANILDPDYKAAGYGFAAGSTTSDGPGGIVTQLFGTDAAGGTGVPSGGNGCTEVARLQAKLKRLKKNGASKSKISKTKKALKKARQACV